MKKLYEKYMDTSLRDYRVPISSSDILKNQRNLIPKKLKRVIDIMDKERPKKKSLYNAKKELSKVMEIIDKMIELS